ncbi:MAG: hypothetical protein HY473_02260 [Candidatus Sungbacteria bacterium]|uniref:CMP/dCMP-type deaminase domain-containing protein n=1 Tax=Candidatus Sungiibacteriota bacterium TaxID=2750080 RepID=A0A933DTP3_9BACT|nr:hypothetical protein [Candidatus Sungbacteria bacterium]
MKERLLVIHIPVIHRGYLDLFRRLVPAVRSVMILGDELAKRLRFFEHDISALRAEEAFEFVAALKLFDTITILEPASLPAIRSQPLLLVNDELSRRLYHELLPGADVQWESVFLRWDESHVARVTPVNPNRQSRDQRDRELLAEAYAEAEQSGDWWRRVGAVLVADGAVRLRAYNRDMPDDQSSYRLGNIRDYLEPGERPDLSNTFHAENRIIAEAARAGMATEGLDLYVTHFPCSMCAKAVAAAGIKRCFFGEGSSNFDAEMVFHAHGVEIIHLPREA